MNQVSEGSSPSGLKKLIANFNVQAGFSTFAGRKIARYAGALLDGIGEQNMLKRMNEGKWLTDYVTEEQKINIKMMVMPYIKIISLVSPEMVYGYLPNKYRAFCECKPGGKEWALSQIEHILISLES